LSAGESTFSWLLGGAEDQAGTLTQAKVDDTTYRIGKQPAGFMLKTRMMLLVVLLGKRGGKHILNKRHPAYGSHSHTRLQPQS